MYSHGTCKFTDTISCLEQFYKTSLMKLIQLEHKLAIAYKRLSIDAVYTTSICHCLWVGGRRNVHHHDTAQTVLRSDVELFVQTLTVSLVKVPLMVAGTHNLLQLPIDVFLQILPKAQVMTKSGCFNWIWHSVVPFKEVLSWAVPWEEESSWQKLRAEQTWGGS